MDAGIFYCPYNPLTGYKSRRMIDKMLKGFDYDKMREIMLDMGIPEDHINSFSAAINASDSDVENVDVTVSISKNFLEDGMFDLICPEHKKHERYFFSWEEGGVKDWEVIPWKEE